MTGVYDQHTKQMIIMSQDNIKQIQFILYGFFVARI